MRVAAFTKYDREAASTRQRLLQYLPSLRAAGIEVDCHPLLCNDYVRGLATGEKPRPLSIARAYLRRLRQLLAGPDCDVIWVYAELFPYLPSGFEKLALRAGKPVVYDFDDAFFVPYDEHRSGVVRRLLSGKLDGLIKGAAFCCCGNQYLRDHAARLNPRSIVLPTVVDTDVYRPRQRPDEGQLTVGWIGSPSTWINVQPIVAVLAELRHKHGIRVRMVGAGVQPDSFDGLEMVDWLEETEVAEVRSFDIGIMPLLDRPFQRGKSGYKLVQYMACGLPVVASPVGVNSDMVKEGENGFLASSVDEWQRALERLILDPNLRARLGAASRARAEERYSLAVQAPRLIEVFRSAVAEA